MSNTKIKTENIIIQTRGKPILSDKQARVFSTAIAADISKYISENQEKFDEWLKKHQQKDRARGDIIGESAKRKRLYADCE